MPKPRRKSKRIRLKTKYKVERKVREHHRQVRKAGKKNPNKRSKLKKDPGIPNMYPFKQQLLNSIQKQRQQEDAHAAKVRAHKHKLRQQSKTQQLHTLMVKAAAAQRDYESRVALQEDAKSNLLAMKETSRKTFYKEFKKVVESADVIVEVLDARDPLGCRCRAVERSILAAHPEKKIVLLLNKVDLVPKDVVEPWLKYLRNEYPTLAFKASTQSQKTRLKQSTITIAQADDGQLQSNECLGAETLVTLLKKYCMVSPKVKGHVSVGIIGYPNVGKSSVINSLKRSRAAGVGATPGFTVKSSTFVLDKNITLLDCPGIVFSSGEHSDAEIILRNCVRIESLDDPITPVELILRRCHKQTLMELYEIPDWSDCTQFLGHIGRKIGRLKKGGVPRYEAAAVAVLQDWNLGKIRFYTMPPEREVSSHASASIVSTLAPAMDMGDVLQQEQVEVLAALKQSPADFVSMDVGDGDDNAFIQSYSMHSAVAMQEDSDDDYEGTAGGKLGRWRVAMPDEADYEEDDSDDDDEVVVVDQDDAEHVEAGSVASAAASSARGEASPSPHAVATGQVAPAPGTPVWKQREQQLNPRTNRDLRLLQKKQSRKRRQKRQLEKANVTPGHDGRMEDDGGENDDAYDWSHFTGEHNEDEVHDMGDDDGDDDDDYVFDV